MNRFPNNLRAVITGAGSGLGRAFALDLAQRKARIVVADLKSDTAAETVALVRQAGGEAEAFTGDVSDPKVVERLAADAMRLYGGTDLLINNAGVVSAGRVGEIPITDWNWILGINLMGVIYGCHYFVPQMKKQGRGWIINVASGAGIASLPEMAPYNVSKAGAISLSESLFSELAPHQINVSALCPTFFKTNLLENLRSQDKRQRTMAHALVNRSKITAERVAAEGLKGVERGKLIVIPQADGRAVWYFKRFWPQLYFR